MAYELWIDADDTLWENNVFFERAFAEFVEYLGHSHFSALQVRAALDKIEHVNNKARGYGAVNFARNLEECFEQLSQRAVTVEDRQRIRSWGDELAEHPLELMEGVEETLEYLALRNRLMLCTKGDPDEQLAKIERSGLKRHFDEVRVVREKDAECYRGLMAERGVAAERCWMVGNSPKSDINPALEAGIGAVYVPHPRTWHLEHEEVPESHQRLIVVKSFAGLRDHF